MNRRGFVTRSLQGSLGLGASIHRWMEVVIGGSLAGLPVVNVPAGFDGQGRPMGMQIMGRFGNDRRVLEFARAYEAVSGHLARRPRLTSAV